MILILKGLGKQAFSADMLLESRLCVVLIELERNHEIGLEHSGELLHHNNGIAAERARGCGRRGIADYLAAAGFADVRTQRALLVFRPLAARRGLPLHIVRTRFVVKTVIEVF